MGLCASSDDVQTLSHHRRHEDASSRSSSQDSPSSRRHHRHGRHHTRHFQESDNTNVNVPELNGDNQVSVDELLARLLFEEELAQLGIRGFGLRMAMAQWGTATATADEVDEPKGLSKAEIEECTVKILVDLECEQEGSRLLDECVVCLNDFESGSTVRKSRCGHFFHTECIDQWLSKTDTCPTCATPIRQDTKAASPSLSSPSLPSRRIPTAPPPPPPFAQRSAEERAEAEAATEAAAAVVLPPPVWSPLPPPHSPEPWQISSQWGHMSPSNDSNRLSSVRSPAPATDAEWSNGEDTGPASPVAEQHLNEEEEEEVCQAGVSNDIQQTTIDTEVPPSPGGFDDCGEPSPRFYVGGAELDDEADDDFVEEAKKVVEEMPPHEEDEYGAGDTHDEWNPMADVDSPKAADDRPVWLPDNDSRRTSSTVAPSVAPAGHARYGSADSADSSNDGRVRSIDHEATEGRPLTAVGQPPRNSQSHLDRRPSETSPLLKTMRSSSMTPRCASPNIRAQNRLLTPSTSNSVESSDGLRISALTLVPASMRGTAGIF